jgi:hypothetical protein
MSGETTAVPTAVPPATAMASSSDDAVSKYKKLLSVARTSLEANQKKMAEKDRTLEQLGGQVLYLHYTLLLLFYFMPCYAIQYCLIIQCYYAVF